MRGNWFSVAAALSFAWEGFGQVSISEHPQGSNTLAGRTFTLSVEASGTPPLQYQWRFNGQDIPGATRPVLKLSGAPSRSGVYSVVVRDATGSQTTSQGARMTVLNRPYFLVQPRDAVVGERTVAEFVTVLNDSGPYTRMIWHNNNPIEGPHEIPPSTGYITDRPTLRMENPFNDPTWNSVYWLAVTNAAGGWAVSRKARLTVVGPPVIKAHPQVQNVNVGGTAVFSVRVAPSPGPPPTYQWYWEGRPLSGQTSSRLHLPNVQPAQRGNYYCVITGIGGKSTSWGAQLNVTTPTPR